MTERIKVPVPSGTGFGIHVHEADDLAVVVAEDGTQYRFNETGLMNPRLHDGSNFFTLRILNTGAGPWRGRFSLYVGNESFPLNLQSGFDVVGSSHDVAILEVIYG